MPKRRWKRLQTASEFQLVRREGRRLRGRDFDLFVFDRGDGGEARLGLAVGRRVGMAVTRNRWKRIVRAFFDQQAADFGASDIVIVPKAPPPPSMWDFAREFDTLWSRYATS